MKPRKDAARAARSGLRATLGRFVLRTLGWSVKFDGLPAPHGVLVVYPHTSNWDFLYGLMTHWMIGQPIFWVAKHTLFRGPVGVVLRAWHGLAIDRRAPRGVVGQLEALIRSHPSCWVAITPEGTRSRTEGWKSGFYRLAVQGHFPVGLAYIDYARREVGVTEFITLTGDEDVDMETIGRYYAGRQGFRPRDAAPVRLLREPPRP